MYIEKKGKMYKGCSRTAGAEAHSSLLGKVLEKTVSVKQWCALQQHCLLLLLYNSILLIQQLPDLVVVVTQAAFQTDASSLRLDRESTKNAQVIYNLRQENCTLKQKINKPRAAYLFCRLLVCRIRI